MSDNSSVCDAIKSRRLIGFEYPDDEGVYHHRTVEPYAHGVTSAVEEVIHGYQVAGVSEMPTVGPSATSLPFGSTSEKISLADSLFHLLMISGAQLA